MKTPFFKFNTGKESDFKRIFEELYPKLCCFADKYLNDPEASEDIVQEFFSDLWSNKSYQNIRNKTFLYTSIKNKCLNYLKKQARDQKRISDYHYLESESIYTHNMLEEEVHDKVYNAIQSLPEKSREIIYLCMSEMSNKEIQEELAISINTVKTNKKRAYRMLRDMLR